MTQQVTLRVVENGARRIAHIPDEFDAQLPSRGLCMLEVTCHEDTIIIPAEPDGKGGHWIYCDALEKYSDDRARLECVMSVCENWPEPEVPADVSSALKNNPNSLATWNRATVRARWDWLRWIRGTLSTQTRERRMHVAMSKLSKDMRSPCCFNRSMCTDPSVCPRGRLDQS